MASIRRHKSTWFACITLADGSRTERATRVKDQGTPKERAEARRLAQSIADEMEQIGRGNRTEIALRKSIESIFNRVNPKRVEFTKVGAFINDWLNRVDLRKSPGTHKRYKQVAEEFLAHLGKRAERYLEDIKASDLQSYFDACLKAGKKPQSVKKEAKILNIPFQLALRQGHIAVNPVPGSDIPEAEGESKQPFTAKQVGDILRHAKDDWLTAAYLGAYTGARLTDCVNLTWGNVDLEKRIIAFEPSKTKQHKKKVWCPIHPGLEAHLLSLPSADNSKKPLCPKLAGRYTGGNTGLSGEFEKLIAKANIPNDPIGKTAGKGRVFKPYGFHSFRHTFKTELVNAGVDPTLADILTGHAKKTVSETYIHRSPELLRTAVKKLPAF
jgi:integrase